MQKYIVYGKLNDESVFVYVHDLNEFIQSHGTKAIFYEDANGNQGGANAKQDFVFEKIEPYNG